jgi:putative acetyltransferase
VHFEAIRGTAAGFYPPEVIEGWAPPVDDGRREQFRRALASGDERFFVAEHAEAVVGFGSIVVSLHEFRSLYVHPHFGRRGIGGAILRELERLASRRGLSTLHLTATVNAEAFYARHGYCVLGRGIHRASTGAELACVRMQKNLGNAAP